MYRLINGFWCLVIGGFLSVAAGQTGAPTLFGLLSIATHLYGVYWFVSFFRSDESR
jgi:hypothetical protein